MPNKYPFFDTQEDSFVLLHAFMKKTQKTPKSELTKAIKEKNDFLSRRSWQAMNWQSFKEKHTLPTEVEEAHKFIIQLIQYRKMHNILSSR